MREAGSMTKPQVKVYTAITTEPSTMDSGSTITSTEKEFKPGLMVVSMKANTRKVRKMDKVNMCGRMVVFILATGRTIK